VRDVHQERARRCLQQHRQDEAARASLRRGGGTSEGSQRDSGGGVARRGRGRSNELRRQVASSFFAVVLAARAPACRHLEQKARTQPPARARGPERPGQRRRSVGRRAGGSDRCSGARRPPPPRAARAADILPVRQSVRRLGPGRMCRGPHGTRTAPARALGRSCGRAGGRGVQASEPHAEPSRPGDGVFAPPLPLVRTT
jgi:hypothetical protein